MLKTPAYAAASATTALGPFTIERREAGPRDVLIDILYCDVCHSDLHQARDEWGGSIFPMVPGYEIVGTVVQWAIATPSRMMACPGDVRNFVFVGYTLVVTSRSLSDLDLKIGPEVLALVKSTEVALAKL